MNDCVCCKAAGKGIVSLSCKSHFLCNKCLEDRTKFVEKPTDLLKCSCSQPVTSGAEAQPAAPITGPSATGTAWVTEQPNNIERSYKAALLKPKNPPVGTVLLPTPQPSCAEAEPTKLPGIFIFVHQSNLWIEAKKYYGELKGFEVEDFRARIDMGRLADVISGDREVAKGMLYGSEPPPVDTVWTKIRERGWIVDTSQRDRHTGKEKQVDTKLVTDVIHIACTTPKHERTTIVLVTGDANVIPAIEGVLREERWKVEVYMWDHAISNQLVKFARKHSDRVKHFGLNAYVNRVTFINTKFNITHPNPLVRRKVKAHGVVFKMETGAFGHRRIPTDDWIDQVDRAAKWPCQCYWYDQPLKTDYLVVVFKPVRHKRVDITKLIPVLEKNQLPLVKEIKSFMHFHGLLQEQAPVDHDLKEFDMALREAKILEDDEDSDEDEAEESNDGDPSKLNHKERGKWKVSLDKHRPLSRRRFTDVCPKRFNCPNGTQCSYSHSQEEIEYFKKQCQSRGNPRRKTSICDHYKKGKCYKRKEDCDFAHGEDDAWCNQCCGFGHLCGNTSMCSKSN